MGRFTGATILVCGGATGIGAATAALLAREGAAVVVQFRTRESEASAVCAQLRDRGADVSTVRADLTDSAAVTTMFDSLGTLDGFVHSISAPLPTEPFDALSWPAYQLHWETSVKSAFLLLQAALRRDPVPGSAVFVSSIVTTGIPPKDWSPYVTAKAGLVGFVRSIAQEAASRGLRLNLVSPGLTETPLTATMDPRRRELAGRSTPLKRLGTVDEAAAAVAFLLSAESSYIVGADLPVAGGTVL